MSRYHYEQPGSELTTTNSNSEYFTVSQTNFDSKYPHLKRIIVGGFPNATDTYTIMPTTRGAIYEELAPNGRLTMGVATRPGESIYTHNDLNGTPATTAFITPTRLGVINILGLEPQQSTQTMHYEDSDTTVSLYPFYGIVKIGRNRPENFGQEIQVQQTSPRVPLVKVTSFYPDNTDPHIVQEEGVGINNNSVALTTQNRTSTFTIKNKNLFVSEKREIIDEQTQLPHHLKEYTVSPDAVDIICADRETKSQVRITNNSIIFAHLQTHDHRYNIAREPLIDKQGNPKKISSFFPSHSYLHVSSTKNPSQTPLHTSFYYNAEYLPLVSAPGEFTSKSTQDSPNPNALVFTTTTAQLRPGIACPYEFKSNKQTRDAHSSEAMQTTDKSHQILLNPKNTELLSGANIDPDKNYLADTHQGLCRINEDDILMFMQRNLTNHRAFHIFRVHDGLGEYRQLIHTPNGPMQLVAALKSPARTAIVEATFTSFRPELLQFSTNTLDSDKLNPLTFWLENSFTSQDMTIDRALHYKV